METPPRSSPTDAEGTHATSAVYTIETVERITRIARDRIELYYRSGLVSTITRQDRADLLFDEDAIHRLRRIAFFAAEYELNPTGLKKLTALLEEVERLREEVRFLRARR